MKYCPNCKTGYQEDSLACSDCRIKLLPNKTACSAPLQKDMSQCNDSNNQEVFLTNVGGLFEADQLELLLRESKIPVLKKLKGTDGYLSVYMGSTNLGVDFYVPSKFVERAKEILQNDFGMEENQKEQDLEFTELLAKEQRKRRLKSWFLLFLLIPGAVLILLAVFYTVFKIWF
jgi:predicted nucleic acid-binding Zn ribbon protein